MPNSTFALSQAQLDHFVTQGFVHIDQAFSPEQAEAALAFLWRQTGCDPENPQTWTKPVIRLAGFGGPLFAGIANTPALHAAYDQLVGPGRWQAPQAIGTFPVRFPSKDDPGDAGWHIDVSFGTENPDFLQWRANVHSKGRALLMLFLFSDVGEQDAPTRIARGSHLAMARALHPAGDAGLTLQQMVDINFAGSTDNPEALATGPSGTVYLCHPFLVHAAQPHHGTRPRFMAQPALFPAEPYVLDRADGDYSPVELAIRKGITG